MKGVGLYTGRIYDNKEREHAQECCHVVTDKQASDEKYLRDMHMDDLLFCILCCGCPEAKKGEGIK